MEIKLAVYLTNRAIPRGLVNKTPLKVWTGLKPNLSKLKIFSSIVMVHIPKEPRKKFDRKPKKCILMGYSDSVKS